MKNCLPLCVGLTALLVLVGACRGGQPAPAMLTPAPMEAPVATHTPPGLAQTETPEPTVSGAVSSLAEIEPALVRVKAQGVFFDPEAKGRQSIAGRGSGFIIDPRGIAVTNNHVVTGAESLSVWVGDDPLTAYPAQVLGVSECYDLAVIDIAGDGYDYLEWESQAAETGQEVSVAGFGLRGAEYLRSRGMITNPNVDGQTAWSSVESLFEYSSRVEPGLSGGPVLTSNGKAIGIHFDALSANRQPLGISYQAAQPVLSRLIVGESTDTLGLNLSVIRDADGENSLWIAGVQPGSAAQAAGLQAGDILIRLNGEPAAESGTLSEYCTLLRSGTADAPLLFEARRPSSGESFQGELLVGGVMPTPTPTATETPRQDGVLNLLASQSGDVFFRYEFTDSLDGLETFFTSGDPSQVEWQVEDGKLHLEFNSVYTYMNFAFQDQAINDVWLDVRAANRGENNNYINLICRYSDLGWYEFSVSSNGLYKIYRFDPGLSNPYKKLWEGGSFAINMGQRENDYGAICQGEQLTLLINGEVVRTVTDDELPEGKVGFAVASLDRPPVVVDVEYFQASVP